MKHVKGQNEPMNQANFTEALAQLRHLYKNMVNGGVATAEQARSAADGLLSPSIASLEKQAQELEAARARIAELEATANSPGLRRIPVIGEIEDEVVVIKKLEIPPGTTWGE